MPASVTVMGLTERPMGGLKESMAVFTKHHKEVGDALLNISGIGTVDGQMADKDEPRLLYNPNDHRWPTRVHHSDGREQDVADKAELDAAVKAGFRREPYRKPQVHVADPATEKKALMDQLADQRQQNVVLTDQLTKLADRLSALEGGPK